MTTRIRARCVAFMSAVGIATAAAGAEPVETDTHRFEEVAEGVYFVSGTGAMVTRSNAMVVVTEEDVLVVDSHITPAAARMRLRRASEWRQLAALSRKLLEHTAAAGASEGR